MTETYYTHYSTLFLKRNERKSQHLQSQTFVQLKIMRMFCQMFFIFIPYIMKTHSHIHTHTKTDKQTDRLTGRKTHTHTHPRMRPHTHRFWLYFGHGVGCYHNVVTLCFQRRYYDQKLTLLQRCFRRRFSDLVLTLQQRHDSDFVFLTKM